MAAKLIDAQRYIAPFTVDLARHTAIITGAASPMGGAIAWALAQAGASVVVNDLNPFRIDALAEAINAQYPERALAGDADVANRFQASALIERARDQFGRVSIFVNGLSIYKRGAMAALDEWDWRRVLDVNLTGVFFCTQLIGRVMADEGGGVIVNLASMVGVRDTLPDAISYATSKAGIIGMTAQSARELAPAGIRVNAVCPPSESLAWESESPSMMALSEMVASTVLFLLSDAARGICGQAIEVSAPPE